MARLEPTGELVVQVRSGDTVGGVDEGVLEVQPQPGVTTAIRVAAEPRRSASADRHDDGSVEHSVSGTPAHGESNTPRVLALLVDRLNRDGASWSAPEIPVAENGADGEAHDGTNLLRIQVTKATPDASFWKSLGKGHASSAFESPADAGNALMEAINHKAQTTGAAEKEELVLALDAVDAPAFALSEVLDAFQQRHAAWAKTQGFRSIWLVGPSVGLVERLDLPS